MVRCHLNGLGSLLLLIYITSTSYAQILKPVKWSFSVNRINDCEAELIFKAKIDEGFHLYSQFLGKDPVTIPTTFTFDKNNNYELIGTQMNSCDFINCFLVSSL